MILLPLDVRAALGANDVLLPRDGSEHPPLVTAHPGLLFDKCLDMWELTRDGVATRKQDKLREWREAFLKSYHRLRRHVAPLLERHLTARARLLQTLGGIRLRAVTAARLVTGLGSGHPSETGLVWHRTLGVPYLPGPGVKGLVRAWAEPERGWGQVSDPGRVRHLFGDLEEVGAGSVIFFDALPVAPPQLELDVMNPHYSDYYQLNEPPADYLSPNLLTFIAVAPEQEFEFAVAPLPRAQATPEDRERDLAEVRELLHGALETLGAGGKTAVGYGLFREFRVI